MIATSSNAADYVDPRYTSDRVTYAADSLGVFDGCERAAWIRQCRAEQFRRLGAKVSHHRVMWWPAAGRCGLSGPQRASLPRLRYFAGAPSYHRGRHWDCKRRST